MDIAEYSIPIGIFSVPVAVAALLFVPHALRDRRLKKSGREVYAACLERIYRGGVSVVKVRCRYQTDEGQWFRAMVTAPDPAPEIGEEFAVVFDPGKPTVVESAHYLNSASSRLAWVFAGLAAVMVTVSLTLAAFG
ncbi:MULTISPECIES: hypothetical protein [unclassified Streptomyces]|uniref:hypothetical protein n=1 Tax=unclassified Streptomyces TaxID=2593676 RepID=UPI001314850A|nr:MULTISPECIES: hypothetical protein [unclassified Streptomyces]